MEWYFASGIDDFVVPKDQELSDRLPSPESWSTWGIRAADCFEFPDKYFFNNGNLDMGHKMDFNSEMLCNEFEMESSTIDKDLSSGSSVGGEVMEESFHQTSFSHDQLDHQLDDIARIEQMDEFFLGSLLDDLPEAGYFHKSFYCAPESESGIVTPDNRLMDVILDSQNVSKDAHSLGSSKHLKAQAFSPSLGCAKGKVAASQLSPCNLDHKERPLVKAPQVKIVFPSEDNRTDGHVDEETSVEEYVLLELENVMAQLNDKTRICFRDALYRLAKNSRQHMVTENQDKEFSAENPPWPGEDEKRYGGKKTMELETNTIDRAIANLMFCRMELNVQDFPVSASVCSEEEIDTGSGPTHYTSKQSEVHDLHHCPILQEDSEVPVLGEGYPQARPIPDRLISTNLAEQ